MVMAVDGGAAHCLKLGWPIHVLVGDLDSLPKATLNRVKKTNPDLELLVYNTDKDQTDFELALEYITTKFSNIGRIEVLCALGGRWDMSISNLLLPFSDCYLSPIRQSRLQKGQTLAPPIVTFRDGNWEIMLLSGPGWTVIKPMPIVRRVSIIPISPRVSKMRLSGDFKYLLNDEDLLQGLTRGICNELGPTGGSIFLHSGQVIVTVSPLFEPGPGFQKFPASIFGWKKLPTASSKSKPDQAEPQKF
jgi:thiamine pyrophosphokinase